MSAKIANRAVMYCWIASTYCIRRGFRYGTVPYLIRGRSQNQISTLGLDQFKFVIHKMGSSWVYFRNCRRPEEACFAPPVLISGVPAALGAPGTLGPRGAPGPPGAVEAPGALGAPGAPAAPSAPGSQGRQRGPGALEASLTFGALGALGVTGAPRAPGAPGRLQRPVRLGTRGAWGARGAGESLGR